ncbi:alpha/beta-hydrolase [Laetiporus sulphureus 93-53]|uniref:Alpha/beta-hydrolase n=1 Tax=Laetiporus sulphureus 93-53 TaxID=1314785 RepID=A0A165BX10_9APHY|nr:alpha/beta-hydrolase [Laetiporus sulphureus 93-53]KZT01805.1 alpha/beta-hydrolase [Laetiporus sulphureus 93-53]
MVNTLRTAIGIVFKTSIDFFCVNPESYAKSGEDVGLVWLDPISEFLIVGEIKQAAAVNAVVPVRLAGYWYGQRGTDGMVGQSAGPDEKVIYELHGGGWVWDSACMCEEMLRYTKDQGCTRAFQIEYRLSQGSLFPPKGAFPAALIDAIAGYNYLVNDLGFKPSNILITGESAGGNLAFALVRYLVNASIRSPPPPRAQFLLSPTADWGRTHIGPDSTMQCNSDSDIVTWFLGGYGTRALLGNLPESDACDNSWISPGSAKLPHVEGCFSGMPPTLIMGGDAEMTLDSMKALRDRLVADNGEKKVTYVEVADTTHIVMCMKWHEPQKTVAYEEFATWVKSIHQ